MTSVALVTGGSRGIGRAIAVRLARDGARVAFAFVERAQESQAVARSIEELGRDAMPLRLDVSDPVAVNEAIERIVAAWGRIDVLVNNAGVFSRSTILETSDEEFTRTFDVNVRGTFNCIRAVLPVMIRQRYGRIVNISSHLAKRGAGARTKATYAATKAAVDAYTKGIALEAGPHSITVNSVAPGWVEKEPVTGERPPEQAQMLEGIPLRRPGRPEEIAAAVAFLASDEAGYVTGEVFDVNGGSWMD